MVGWTRKNKFPLSCSIGIKLLLLPSLFNGGNGAFDRRAMLSTAAGTAAARLLLDSPAVSLAEAEGIISAKLAQRNAAALKKPLFNFAPGRQVYPPWFEGTFETTIQFRGFEFPSISGLTKQEIVSDVSVAGFQKLSIAQLVDVGRETTTYQSRWVKDPDNGGTVVEDRAYNLKSAIDATIGYETVQSVEYDGRRNPNRASIIFKEASTRNAERIELFSNARASELYEPSASLPQQSSALPLFYCSEYLRQVTFSLSKQFGVPREVVTEYQYFWTHRLMPSVEYEDGSADNMRCIKSNLLTCAYLQPQDALFFKAADTPVVVYSHDLTHRKLNG